MRGDGELWHLVEAKREDGVATMFRIRELPPRPELFKIFVVELAYPATELSRLPSAADYRRLADFEEQWLDPACSALGWERVGQKTEDGSFFLYMYGRSDPAELVARLAPFDAALGFYDDDDPEWAEYATLRELLERARSLPAAPAPAARPTPQPTVPMTMKKRARGKARPKAKRKAKKAR
ncbi:MAG TPA: DUF695 domain-containing protein [Kofleriaceae bacterium]|nr:DUF695 domain-containing protein [Kofleriaceae bacterium]